MTNDCVLTTRSCSCWMASCNEAAISSEDVLNALCDRSTEARTAPKAYSEPAAPTTTNNAATTTQIRRCLRCRRLPAESFDHRTASICNGGPTPRAIRTPSAYTDSATRSPHSWRCSISRVTTGPLLMRNIGTTPAQRQTNSACRFATQSSSCVGRLSSWARHPFSESGHGTRPAAPIAGQVHPSTVPLGASHTSGGRVRVEVLGGHDAHQRP
jgi:hypothetical protein